MAGFDDSTIATRTRDAMTRLMVQTLDTARPPYRYATVKQIDPDIRSAKVWYPESGDQTNPANWITVKIGGIVPVKTGQTVRIEGRQGDKFIAGVIGAARTDDVSATELAAPVILSMSGGIGLVDLAWRGVDGASNYRVQFADDGLFTVNVREFVTKSTAFILNNISPGSLVYGRVQALTSYGAGGPWSLNASATAIDFPASLPTDGRPPESSPQPVVTGALGMLIAEWVPVSNPDLVSYNVYISTQSGFQPSEATFVGETTGTFYVITALGDGTALVTGTQHFVRLIAKDGDGVAPVGAQGAGSPTTVDLGDVGNLPNGAISDGSVPTNAGGTPVVTSGIGYLLVKWDHVSNPDAVTYDLHISNTPNFTPNSNTLVGNTPANFAFIRKQGPGANSAPLVYGVVYYIRLWVRDADGYALNASAAGSGFTIQASTADIAVGAITAASAIIADAAIGTAKIQDAAITTLKVADLAVNEAKIANLSVSNAKLANLAVSNAKIQDLAVNSAKISSLQVDKLIGGLITGQAIYLNGFSSVLASTNFSGGTQGWIIRGNGEAEFNQVTVRGGVYASFGRIAGWEIDGGLLRKGLVTLDPNGHITGAILHFNGSSAVFPQARIEGAADGGIQLHAPQGTLGFRGRCAWSAKNDGDFNIRGAYVFGEVETNTEIFIHPTFFNGRRIAMFGTAKGLFDANVQAHTFIYTVAPTAASDQVLKKSIRSLEPGSLPLVRSTPVRRYKMKASKETGETGKEERLGWIAQEVPADAQSRIVGPNGPVLGFMPDVMLAHAWKAIQELADQVDSLTQRGKYEV